MENKLIKPIIIFISLCLLTATIIFDIYIIMFYVVLVLIIIFLLWLIFGLFFGMIN
jgi:hypothetical protein